MIVQAYWYSGTHYLAVNSSSQGMNCQSQRVGYIQTSSSVFENRSTVLNNAKKKAGLFFPNTNTLKEVNTEC